MKKVNVLTAKPFILIYFLLLAFSFTAQAQGLGEPMEQTPQPFWSNVRFGGSVGLAFGNGYFNGALSPSAVYDFNQVMSAGVTLSGAYAKQNTFSATSLGGSIISLIRPIKEIQLSIEYEQLNINRRLETEGANLREQYWVPALFLGVGYNTGPVVTGVRYNVLHDNNRSFYNQAFMPFVSVYF